jgi:hypothetical protein
MTTSLTHLPSDKANATHDLEISHLELKLEKDKMSVAIDVS